VADVPRTTGLRLQPPTAAREKRLATLLAERGRSADDPALAEVVADAQLLGSLELAGLAATWEEVRRSRTSADLAPPPVPALRRAQAAVAPDAPLTVSALRAWHEAIAGPVGFRVAERLREDAPTAPPVLIEGRLETLEEWLTAAGMRDLKPEQAAGLTYARLVEVLPFEDANGRVARLAASHVMVRAALRPPILVAADGPYLLACLRAAFRLDTEPLVSLLVEASGRALDVMIQALEREEA
jgi:hypothetical protein